MNKNYYFTSESVTEGHPDKMCDIISDAILDAYLTQDPYARVACETAVTTGIVHIMGEITSSAIVDINHVVRQTIKQIGYTGTSFGFDGDCCAIIQELDRQSEDIDLGVGKSYEYKNREVTCLRGNNPTDKEDKDRIGAGDQGMMFGYACIETENLMPAPIEYAHKLCKQLSSARRNGILPYLGPDGKSMVTFEYRDALPARIDTIVISTQHLPDFTVDRIHKDIIEHVIYPIVPKKYMDCDTKIFVNPTGRFVKGGPSADSGLTGRKIIVDTYGGMGRHGGGAFSGKDPTKVDRTGAYAARYVAKNIVAAGIAERCEVQIAYAIGVAQPVSIYVDTFGTSEYSEQSIAEAVKVVFDLRPASLIAQFGLRKPIYKKLAAYGHLGRIDISVPWEKNDKVVALKNMLR